MVIHPEVVARFNGSRSRDTTGDHISHGCHVDGYLVRGLLNQANTTDHNSPAAERRQFKCVLKRDRGAYAHDLQALDIIDVPHRKAF